jgi:TATA-box binding protein (TBP) (component of TFIID and TFIIIB)
MTYNIEEFVGGSNFENVLKNHLKTKSELKEIEGNKNYGEKIGYNFDIENKPAEMKISTMTITCHFNTIFNVIDITEYINLNMNSIISIKCGTKIRSLVYKKKRNSKPTKKKKKYFYNQATVKIQTKKDNVINLKLFINGSIQLTGCKSIEGVYEALTKLFYELKQEVAIMDYKNKKIIEKPFVENKDILDIKNIKKFTIQMINSNFKMGFAINREKLYKYMIEDGIDCRFEPDVHAGVIVGYDINNKKISILIFEKGSIVITGAVNCYQIKQAYEYINKYLLSIYDKIILNEELTNETILKYLELELNNLN